MQLLLCYSFFFVWKVRVSKKARVVNLLIYFELVNLIDLLSFVTNYILKHEQRNHLVKASSCLFLCISLKSILSLTTTDPTRIHCGLQCLFKGNLYTNDRPICLVVLVTSLLNLVAADVNCSVDTNKFIFLYFIINFQRLTSKLIPCYYYYSWWLTTDHC